MRGGIGHRPDVHKRNFLRFGVCIEIWQPPPPELMDVHGHPDCKIFSFRFGRLRAIRTSVNGGGRCMFQTDDVGQGGVQKVTFWSDVFDG